MKILEAEITGLKHGQTLEQPYRVILKENRDGEIVLHPEQAFKKDGKWVFNEYSMLAGWNLKTLLERKSNILYIDYGSSWAISGLEDALNEALELVDIKLK